MTRYLTACVFVLFLLAPLASLAAFGPQRTNSAPERPFIWHKMLQSKDRYRNQIVTQLVNRTMARHLASQARSFFDYSVFDAVDTDSVISGAGDWLFYKYQFGPRQCLGDEEVTAALDTLEALRAVAEGAGIRFVVSVSPDKSVAEPEHLGLRAGALAGCKLEAAARWRAIARDLGAPVIDHLEAMRDVDPSKDLYFATDTHWNELGQAAAMRQLTKALFGTDPGLPEADQAVPVAKPTDLRTSMLSLPELEVTDTFPAYWAGPFTQAAGGGLAQVLVLHDSFYIAAADKTRILFPGATDLEIDKIGTDGGETEALLAALSRRPSLFLINSVERRFFLRVREGPFNWQSPIGQGLLRVNQETARSCRYAPPSAARTDGTEAASRVTRLSGGDLRILMPEGNEPPCLRIRFRTSAEGPSRLFLPAPRGAEDRPGLSIPFEGAGPERLVEIALPARYAGKAVRFHPPAGGSDDLAVALGTRPPETQAGGTKRGVDEGL
ncbi:hypothetical protein L0F51_13375 [Afifella sp. H1R]|uniref:alginate O-acetyltransferase AlgX-related protein n=1 Tax=Afifella sp. H1R TaxID=2908841 RepID=UPI001F32D4A2|nr:hypothetical protein [Afifella sp. H1R]MCF1504741.1 hypothetical protein [Afifella sp. H1R]